MRTLKTRFKRLLRLREFEFFQVVSQDSEKYAFLLFCDQRLSKDGNKVDIYLISDFELSDESYQDVLSFNDDMLGMKHSCSYCMDIVSVKEEFDFDFPFDMLAIRTYVQEILDLVGIEKQLPEFEETDFDYLSQE
ncbi:hypothetical protein [Bacillus sp. YKCMOAS1]|uniref:hypothetical protein n=1 Tax=Bacillus sp. YKCMOAS1 TaxID=2925778 RepID=UPI00253B46F1|nr:hypothetical protein [Bacillus sp. YKCMOAS1]GLJ04622.1 hypothetical protein OAS1_38690 [Bacillus sp. YKCMOAS1]